MNQQGEVGIYDLYSFLWQVCRKTALQIRATSMGSNPINLSVGYKHVMPTASGTCIADLRNRKIY